MGKAKPVRVGMGQRLLQRRPGLRVMLQEEEVGDDPARQHAPQVLQRQARRIVTGAA